MSDNVASPPSTKLSSRRREREFMRYAEIVLGLPTSQNNVAARSSADIALTAYAQLVALRLNARRAVVSLFDKDSQYVLAEATQTLSLQGDQIHKADDELFWGSSVLPRRVDFFSQPSKSRGANALIINDLQQDEAFSKHPYVTGRPFARSYVGVPLINPNGFAIGTLALVDDKARDGIDEVQIKFMRDVATTIIDHLELERARLAHKRGMQLVKGLSRFMEGKDSIDVDLGLQGQRLDAFADRQAAQTSKLGGSSRTQALNTASNTERMDEAYQHVTGQTRIRSHSGDKPRRSPSPSPQAVRGSEKNDSPATIRESGRLPLPLSRLHSERSDVSTGNNSEGGTSKDYREAFGRAAKIVQQAMDVTGVLFLDASVAEFGGLRTSDESSGHDSSDPESHSETSDRTGGPARSNTSTDEFQDRPNCRQLGSAYRPMSTNDALIVHRPVPEQFLKSLMKAFPYGTIYNFDADERPLSSDEQSDSSGTAESEHPQDDSTVTTRRVRRRRAISKRHEHHKIILDLFPGVRSLGVMPMWDSNRQRFFAGAVVWTYDRTRMLSNQEDLNYLAAFSDLIMAEVGRLDNHAEVRAKQDFISSISHELRSPLHGILGSVECLQDKEDNAEQLLQMIDTCGRSLLDIINNLLEHAQDSSNSSSKDGKHRAGKEKRLRRRSQSTSSEPVNDLALLTEEIMDTALWSTPHPAPSRSLQPRNNLTSNDSSPLKVMLNVDSSNLSETGWNFHVNAGAWRRILQNLTANAIKYTDTGGYFRVTLSVRDGPEKTTRVQTIELSCTDSGRGMAQNFLQEGMFRAFRQEDNHSQGTGLGLSLVHGLVEDIGGTIDVQSSKGKGTTFTIVVALVRGAPTRPGSAGVDVASRMRLKGLTYEISGFSTEDQDDKRTTEAIDVLHDMLEKSCRELGLVPYDAATATSTASDVFILSERKATSSSTADLLTKPTLVLCDSVRSSRTASSGLGWATLVSQPLGPRKILKGLLACLDKPSGNALEPLQSGMRSPMGEIESPMSTQSLFSPASVAETLSNAMQPARPRFSRSSTLKNSPAAPSPKSLCVLLVDDNSVNLAILQKYMTKLGYRYISAENGLVALKAYQDASQVDKGDEQQRQQRQKQPQADGDSTPTAKEEAVLRRPNVVLMDLMMPEMDGLESTRRIRSHERSLGLRPAIIVALTAQASDEAMQEAYSSGVNVFLSKPVGLTQLARVFQDLYTDPDAAASSE